MYDNINWNFIVEEEGDWSIGYVPNVKNPKTNKINSGTSIISGFDLGQHTQKDILALKLSDGLTKKLLPFVGSKGPSAVMMMQRQFEHTLDKLSSLNSGYGGYSESAAAGGMQPLGVHGDKNGPWKNADGSFKSPGPGIPLTHFVAAETVFALELSPDERNELIPVIRRAYYEPLARAYNLASPPTRFQMLPPPIQTALISLSWHTGNIWSRHHDAKDVFDAAVKQDWPDVVDSLRGGPIYYMPQYFKFRKRRHKEADLVIDEKKLDRNMIGPKERANMLRNIERQCIASRTA